MAASSLLIVDDEQQLRSIMVENLEPLGVTISSARDGSEALDVIRQSRFDAVLCDVRMPGLDGISLLRKVREDGLDTPFVFMTGFADTEQMRMAIRLGAIDFLEKPWQTADLMSAIMRALEIGRTSKRMETKIQNSLARPDSWGELEEYYKKLVQLRARQ